MYTDYVYRFTVTKGDSIEDLTTYGTSYLWVPEDQGEYTITVSAYRPTYINHKLVGEEFCGSTVTKYNIVGNLTVSKITTSLASPRSTGSKIKLSSNFTGGAGPVQTEYSVYDGLHWKIIKPYSIESETVWEPSVACTYTLQVKVKDILGVESLSQMYFYIYDKLIVEFNQEPDNSTLDLGNSKVLDCISVGGYGRKCYKFVAFDGSKWTTLSDYRYSSSVEWKPSKVGKYRIVVAIKDTIGTVSYARLNINVVDPLKLISSTVNGDKSYLDLGKSLKLSTVSKGGIGSVFYTFETFINRTWSVLQKSTQPSVLWTPTVAGTYILGSTVSDSSGQGISTNKIVEVLEKPLVLNKIITSKISPQKLGQSVVVSAIGSNSVGTVMYLSLIHI
jgi:hypothetical protein